MTDFRNVQAAHRAPSIGEFPAFTELTLAHRGAYEAFTKDYPPVADLSFETLVQWWSHVGDAKVATLGDNLVTLYWSHGDEDYSGLSLAGTHDVDTSLCMIFDFLRAHGHAVRVVNVPEFVVHHIQYPELFKFTPSPRDDEYLIPAAQFAKVQGFPAFKRAKIKRFMRETARRKVEVGHMNLQLPWNQRAILEAAERWPRKGINALGKRESEVLKATIPLAHELGMRNICLFIDDELEAYCLYHLPQDKQHVIIDHGRVNYRIPGLFDYMVHAFSQWFDEHGVTYINLHADLNAAQVRVIKLALRPASFFRKYTIEPA